MKITRRKIRSSRNIRASYKEDFVVDYDLSKMNDEWWKKQENKRIARELVDEYHGDPRYEFEVKDKYSFDDDEAIAAIMYCFKMNESAAAKYLEKADIGKLISCVDRYRKDRFDYEDAREFTEEYLNASTNVNASSTRDRISGLQDKIEYLETMINERRDQYVDPEELIDDQLELEELKDELRFAWAEDEAEYNYALQQQEFNPDGSLKGYGDGISF